MQDKNTHTHVGRSTDKSVGDRIDQLSGHSKITDFDLTFGVEEDIGGLDICGVVGKGRMHVSKLRTFVLDRDTGRKRAERNSRSSPR